MMCCANCGISAIDDIELKDCDACDLVKYCSDECQKDHKDNHGEECKKRKAELRDRDLFTMPDGSHLGECPICCLPLSIDPSKSTFMNCCSKSICNGCSYANSKREVEAGLEERCVFCREPYPNSYEEVEKRCKKRIKKNDLATINLMAKKHFREGDYETALEYLTKAAEMGYADAHFGLSNFYYEGEVVEKDTEKAIYHLEEAAIAGHPRARRNLGVYEKINGRFERARKHFIIAANLGWHDSLQELRELYANGHASKEDYASALRAYQAATEEAKSAEREIAEAFYKATGEL